MKTYKEFENAVLVEGQCLECNCDMYNEGPIHDDILLCHACYDNDTLIKWGYFTEEELIRRP